MTISGDFLFKLFLFFSIFERMAATLVFLAGEFHGQKSLSYSQYWVPKSDMTEVAQHEPHVWEEKVVLSSVLNL